MLLLLQDAQNCILPTPLARTPCTLLAHFLATPETDPKAFQCHTSYRFSFVKHTLSGPATQLLKNKVANPHELATHEISPAYRRSRITTITMTSRRPTPPPPTQTALARRGENNRCMMFFFLLSGVVLLSNNRVCSQRYRACPREQPALDRGARANGDTYLGQDCPGENGRHAQRGR